MFKSTEKPLVYNGPSMYPIFKSADFLDVIPYDGKEIKIGDVIVFNSPLDGKSITHRVMAITRKGIQTRGDNNSKSDPYFLSKENIVGRVISIKRSKKYIVVYGGFGGKLQEIFVRSKRLVFQVLAKILSPFYRGIIKFGLFHKILPRNFAPHVIKFKKKWGYEKQLFLGGFFVGRYIPQRGWWIKPPFKIFINFKDFLK